MCISDYNEISMFLDADGKIKQMPAKIKKRTIILKYLSTKFSVGHDYTEKEVNAIIDNWHTFGDYFILRRELIDYKFLYRTQNGSRYWKENNL